MSEKALTQDNLDPKRLSDAVEFDFDDFEVVELENRDEFMPLNQCEGGGCCGSGGWYNAALRHC